MVLSYSKQLKLNANLSIFVRKRLLFHVLQVNHVSLIKKYENLVDLIFFSSKNITKQCYKTKKIIILQSKLQGILFL